MGKEAKIGVAVVGVLLLGFGGLLARRLVLSEGGAIADPEASRAAHVEPSPADGKPTVVMAQRESADSERAAAHREEWNHRPDRGVGGDVPRASYLPADAPGESLPRDEERAETAVDEPEPAQQQFRGRENPFDRGSAAGANERTERVPTERRGFEEREARAIEPVEEEPRRAVANPLRRASLEVPLDDAGADTAAPNKLTPQDGQPGEAVIDSDRSSGEPTIAAPDDDIPVAAGDPPAADIIPDAAPPRRSPWRGAVEPASNNAFEPAAVENGKYTIQPNDSLWIVSEKVYGTGRYFKAIHEHNRTRLPRADRLAVGTVIAVPPVAVLEQNYPSLCPKQRKSALVKPRTIEASTRQRSVGANVYVVEEGDTLFDIARYELGKASRWAEIYDLNRDALGEDFDYLQPGTQLNMPARSQSDAITRQRDNGIQR